MAHETDSLGFPLRPDCCEHCRRVSSVMNARVVQRLFIHTIGGRGDNEEYPGEADARNLTPRGFNRNSEPLS